MSNKKNLHYPLELLQIYIGFVFFLARKYLFLSLYSYPHSLRRIQISTKQSIIPLILGNIRIILYVFWESPDIKLVFVKEYRKFRQRKTA